MNNQKETGFGKNPRFSKGKVVAVIIMLVIFIVGGIIVFISFPLHEFLRQSGAIAVESWKDIFVQAASGTLVSEVDPALSGVVSSSEKILPGVSSTKVSVTDKGVSMHSDLSLRSVASDIPVAADVTSKDDQAVAGNSVDVASSSPPPTILSVPAEILETGILASDTASGNKKSNAPEAGYGKSVNCIFPASVPANISHGVILNEIAWMGSPVAPGESADHAADREWIELKNISGTEISLEGWQIMDASGKIRISFGSGDELLPNMLYLLSRNGNFVDSLSDDKAYTGVLPNSGDKLGIFDASCGVSDFIDASSEWPGGSNSTKQTLERTKDLSWQTSIDAGGTPRAENSAGAAIADTTSSSVERYDMDLAIVGDGSGKVTVKPGSIVCKISCVHEYAAGTTVTLTAAPSGGTTFIGWSGGCSGTEECSFVIDGMVSVTANFRLNADALLVTDDNVQGDATNVVATTSISNAATTVSDVIGTADIADQASPSSSPPLPSSGSALVNHPVIAEIQIAGAMAGDDFVKIYNPTPVTLDIGGWKLRKKSSTGSDASLREFPAGSTLAPDARFTWASDAAGFAQSIGADVSSTETLSVSNSVALFDGSGTQIDAVAWGTGTNQYVEGSPYPQNPVADQVLRRKFTDGMVVDTDNNSNDFNL